jgi:hypothetical protein
MHVALLTGHIPVDRFGYVHKQGLVLEDWISHISVGVEICKLSLALRVGALVELFLYSVDVDKPQGL